MDHCQQQWIILLLFILETFKANKKHQEIQKKITSSASTKTKDWRIWIDIFPNLADNEGIRVLEQTLGISQESVCHFIDRFLKALLDIKQEKIMWSQGSKLATIIRGFEHGISGLENNLLNVIGAIDRSHIPIHPPSKNGSQFVNYKNFHFINLFGVVDYLEHFTYVHIGEAD
ncbi:9908_t:CDS:2 [Cetraspora pellucida]|uniref:9908_t:CDS:1 n=1 Tax=Cetraspora pellucida TaxID=1433469 RepID=A0A9N9JJ78_9GLOM|nr:9908_t:CDS:2 [Cetraspora pellucida]